MWTKVASIFMLCLHISQCCSCSINNSWLSKLKIGMHIRLMFLLANGANGVPIWPTKNQCSKHLWYVVSLQLHGLHCTSIINLVQEQCLISCWESVAIIVNVTPDLNHFNDFLYLPHPLHVTMAITTEDNLSHQYSISGYKACYDVSCLKVTDRP